MSLKPYETIKMKDKPKPWDGPDVSLSTELSGSTPIKLLASDGVGLAAFHYWYTCPECKYVWIRMQDNYCGGCGREIEVMVA